MKQSSKRNNTKLNSVDSDNTKLNSVLKGEIRVKRGDNPTCKPLTLLSLHSYTVALSALMIKYRLRFEGFRELLNITSVYVLERRMLTKFAISKMSGVTDTSHQAAFKRVDLLLSKGLIEVVKNEGDRYSYYRPTQKALNELTELLKD